MAQTNFDNDREGRRKRNHQQTMNKLSLHVVDTTKKPSLYHRLPSFVFRNWTNETTAAAGLLELIVDE